MIGPACNGAEMRGAGTNLHPVVYVTTKSETVGCVSEMDLRLTCLS